MIELTQERVKELFDYDYENGCLLRKEDNHGRIVNRPCGHKSAAYGYVGIDGKSYRVHRVIWLLVYGTWPEHEIDHIDQNKLNNRIENLRPTTRSENMRNIKMHRDNSSGYPGVSWDKKAWKFRADIRADNKNIYLGYFNTAEEAFLEYMLSKIKYHPTSPVTQEYLRELTYAA